MTWVFVALSALLVGLAIWEIWICEGAHLGRHLVVWLYDLAATRYDAIKHFDPDWERLFLGEPMANALASIPEARVLDVGAGTGRAARSVLPWFDFKGSFVSVEPSEPMLKIGRKKAAFDRVYWVRGWGDRLPFAEGTFDLVVSLEVLEFTPRPEALIKDIVRVMRPGGWLLLTNRVGRQAPWILGHTYSRKLFPNLLTKLGLCDVAVYPWQVEYDLAWARRC